MNHFIVRALALALLLATAFLVPLSTTGCGQSTPNNSALNTTSEPVSSEPVSMEQTVVLLTWAGENYREKAMEEERLQRIIREGGWSIKSTDTKSANKRIRELEFTNWTTTVVLERVRRSVANDPDAVKRREQEEREKLRLQLLWSKLEKGMTDQQVRDILGDPLLVENSQTVEGCFDWYFDAQKRLYVTFYKDKRAIAWSVP